MFADQPKLRCEACSHVSAGRGVYEWGHLDSPLDIWNNYGIAKKGV